MIKRIFLGIIVLAITTIGYGLLEHQIRTQSISVSPYLATKLPTTPLVGRAYIMITNNDLADTIYIGSSTVTVSGSTMGTPLQPSEQYRGQWSNDVDIYGISGGDTVIVTIEEGK